MKEEEAMNCNLPAKSVIHKWALASAATAGVLPIGLDALALTTEEIAMVIHVATLFGHEINEKTAEQALATGALGNTVGTAIFEGLNVGYPFTIPLKIGIAGSVMEALGLATYAFFKAGKMLQEA